MLIRMVGVAFLAAAGFLAGREKLAEKKREIEFLESLAAALGCAASEIGFCRRPLYEIFSGLAGRGAEACRDFFLIMASERDCSVEEKWQKAVEQARTDRETKQLLSALGTVLGRYEPDRQLGEINSLRQRLKERAEEKRAEIKQAAKNYPALGMCAGAVAGILMI